MDAEKIIGLTLLFWLIGSVVLMARLVRRGRKLTAELAARHPETYESLGRPQPGLLQSARSRRFAQFIARRAYEDIGDPALCAQFEEYRKAEVRLLVFVLATLAIAALLTLAIRQAKLYLSCI